MSRTFYLRLRNPGSVVNVTASRRQHRTVTTRQDESPDIVNHPTQGRQADTADSSFHGMPGLRETNGSRTPPRPGQGWENMRRTLRQGGHGFQ